MNEQVWWYASRSSGIIAWILITASVAWGLFLSTRVLGQNPAPAWLLDLHRMLGGLSVIFTGIHVGGLAADSFLYFGWAEVFVPGASQWQPFPVALGVVAFYLMMAIQLTSIFMRHLPRKLWRAVHYLSWPLFLLVTLHGLWAGTDVENPYFFWAAVGSVQLIAFLTILRVMAQRKARRRAERSTPSSVPV